MSLLIHESIHLFFSFLVGYFIWKKYKKFFMSFFVAFVGGFLIDIDHLIDYFFAFGFKFNLNHFLKGYQFLRSDRIYVPFHSWEIVTLLIILYLLISSSKNKIYFKTILFSFSMALFFHLAIDVVLNKAPIRSYSFIYRSHKNFSLEELIYPEHYKKHLQDKKTIRLDY